MGCYRSVDVRKLLHNKYVVVLGDSIQRSVYKDLVKMLQDDAFLSEEQMRKRGELSFENDALVEGGELDGLHNGTTFREVRQYRSDHHLVRFYFLTRVYSTYLESVLSDLQSGHQPDVLIANSCVWDVNRYNDKNLEAYKTNLDTMFQRLKEVLSPECLIIWNTTMPVGFKHCEIPEYMVHNLQMDVVEGNFFSATLADLHKLDVLDMHYHFRCDLRLRCPDSIHWNQVAHRKYTQILLTHIAQAWGVRAPKGKKLKCSPFDSAVPDSVPMREHLDPNANLLPSIQEQEHCSQFRGPLLPTPCPGGTLWGQQPRLPAPVNADGAYIPRHPLFEGSDINTMPGSPHMLLSPPDWAVMGPQYTGQRMMCPGGTEWGQQPQLPAPVNADGAYIPRHPLFEGNDINAMPGYSVHPAPPDNGALREDPYHRFNPVFEEQEGCSQVPAFPSQPFMGQNFFPPGMPVPLMNVTHAPHDPYPQEDPNMRMTSRRMLNLRRGWTHPYSRPPPYLPRIY
ncbi:PC-esterase domain-containing protein 1B-like isoform X2 [Bufo bufo]|nr:PC-esterase domain-containing protein 1B-like isoform X2 [Bufo bufo]XP_040275347.1 PC-esterase domain-containing protein 1B-like isoform X2 [Bufo bufo]